MTPPTRLDPSARVLSYETGGVRRRFSASAFFLGLLLPYAYAVVALFVIGLFTSRTSAILAFYAFEPGVIVALALFPVVVWLVYRRAARRGFVAGVVTGTLLTPIVAVVLVAISFRHGV